MEAFESHANYVVLVVFESYYLPRGKQGIQGIKVLTAQPKSDIEKKKILDMNIRFMDKRFVSACILSVFFLYKSIIFVFIFFRKGLPLKTFKNLLEFEIKVF